MRLSFFLLFSLALFGAQAQGSSSSFFDEADAIFNQYVKQGRVDYSRLKSDGALAPIINQVATYSLEGKDATFKKAFYINAYNLLVLKSVVDRLPLSSVLKVDGFFNQQRHQVAGESLSLDEIEKKKLLATYGDPRFHFVVVCGAVDCPPITNFAYRPATLNKQLARQTRKALNNPGFIKVNAAQQKVEISQIFEWYQKDFGGSKAEALTFINRYRNEPIPTDYSIGYYSYDWSLNGR